MRQLLRRLVGDLRATGAGQPARRVRRRAFLQVEDMEARMVLSSASLVGSTLQISADPGRGGVVFGGHFNPPVIQQINLHADAQNPGMLDVSEGATALGQFPIASIKSANVNLVYLDAVNIDYSNGVAFRPGTTISVSGGSGFANSLNLTGSQVIGTGETYISGNSGQAVSLSLAGATYQFSGAINSITDTIRTTAPLDVEALDQGGVGVTLNNGPSVGKQQLAYSAFVNGSFTSGTSLTFSNKPGVELELSGADDTAALNATAAATSEQFFEVDLYGVGEQASIDASPATVSTRVVADNGGEVDLLANAGPVSISGTSSTFVVVGDNYSGPGAGGDSTAQIDANVSVNGAGTLLVDNSANATTHENVKVTESTVSGTGLFGNNAAVLTYSNLSSGFEQGLEIWTGSLSNTYTVAASGPNATFKAPITIDSGAPGGSNVTVDVDARSGLNLMLRPDGGSLFISGVGGTFQSSAGGQVTVTTVTFAGGLTSTVNYDDFNSVTLFSGVQHL